MKKQLSIGFMLFAMFFGAGNLIFPPKLGLESGHFFWPVMTGFVLTGVGLPLLGVIVGAIDKRGYEGALNEISPIYSILLLSTIYIVIGPLFSIPRTGTTAYELTVGSAIKNPGAVSLALFSLIYFAVVTYISLNPNKLVDRIGSLLTPILLIIITAIVIRGFFILGHAPQTAGNKEMFPTLPASFSNGLSEGYLTMDALAAITFSILIINAIKLSGVFDKKKLFKSVAIAAVSAGALLALVYISLAFIGNHVNLSTAEMADITKNDKNLGVYLLSHISQLGYGRFGAILLGLAVTIACLTTAIGLIVAVSTYFHSVVPKVPYKTFVYGFSFISFVLSNLGLNQVISMSVPVLSLIYPIAITTMLLILLASIIPMKPIVQRITVICMVIFSIIDMMHRNDLLSISGFEKLPFYSISLEWLPIALFVIIISYLISLMTRQVPIKYQND
ncbi:branched-chain amino acid transport system II carrier protein [Macrococcus brunensis]|uniref:Branched-chain amino acid transport system carrier protein n=1 Tax=Macrococcus brunensis TaxID=198483 RepID=A0A4R6BEB2_9STAP|nr:branched-chain amino acid transport system II carrier protein [Macrococcus brunensis]TDL98105.1 branched-chain amino acid transport system II carrier protein [Macrococcus brunensis]ULG74515.1 branched-chain amino acid transport system II carrier protein [Macrococcus brunensis]